MKPRLDMQKIAKGLGGERRGPVTASCGHFGAMNLAAEIGERFKTPQTGGRRTDPNWTERRQVPFRHETLQLLEKLVAQIREHGGEEVHPMQLAALLLERAAASVSDADALKLVERARSRSSGGSSVR